jgi:SAM-dependent methyltransferase
VLRALFWTLVYHLEPARWDALARAEPIHPGLLEALPGAPRSAVDVAAGSGRLTGHLAARCARVIAVEPALGLARLLRSNVPQAFAVAGWAEALPVRSGWSELTVSCGAFGPDAPVLEEMARVTHTGGVIALISPERPEEFAALGWRRLSLEPLPAPAHDTWIDEFFGPLDPPHEMVYRQCST